MNQEEEIREVSACPRRNWVLSRLSDDESPDARGEMSAGLRIHLARCACCRELADRLMAANRVLQSVTGLEPPERLADRADHRAIAALEDGARMTGRVDLTEALVDDDVFVKPSFWRRHRQPALAACLFLAFALSGISYSVLRRGPSPETDTRFADDFRSPPSIPAYRPIVILEEQTRAEDSETTWASAWRDEGPIDDAGSAWGYPERPRPWLPAGGNGAVGPFDTVYGYELWIDNRPPSRSTGARSEVDHP